MPSEDDMEISFDELPLDEDTVVRLYDCDKLLKSWQLIGWE